MTGLKLSILFFVFCVMIWIMFLSCNVMCSVLTHALCSVLLVLGIPNDDWQDELLLLAIQRKNAPSACQKQTKENHANGNDYFTNFVSYKGVHV